MKFFKKLIIIIAFIGIVITHAFADEIKVKKQIVNHGKINTLTITIFQKEVIVKKYNLSKYEGYYCDKKKGILTIFEPNNGNYVKCYYVGKVLYYENNKEYLLANYQFTDREFSPYPAYQSDGPLYDNPSIREKIGRNILSGITLSSDFHYNSEIASAEVNKIQELIFYAKIGDTGQIKEMIVPSDEYRKKPDIDEVAKEIQRLIKKNKIFSISKKTGSFPGNRKVTFYYIFFPEKEKDGYRSLSLEYKNGKLKFVLR